MLKFDAAKHEYRWSDQIVPSVTRIVSPLISHLAAVPPDQLERARLEGKAIHKMVELECKGKLESVPEWLRGHHNAWRTFVEQTGFACWATEEPLYHPLGYAGTPDLIGTMAQIKGKQCPAVLDIKRSFYAGRVIGYQLAAYESAWNRCRPRDMHVARRFALRLSADGQYRLEEFSDKNDFAVFLACLTIFRAKVEINGATTKYA